MVGAGFLQVMLTRRVGHQRAGHHHPAQVDTGTERQANVRGNLRERGSSNKPENKAEHIEHVPKV